MAPPAEIDIVGLEVEGLGVAEAGAVEGADEGRGCGHRATLWAGMAANRRVISSGVRTSGWVGLALVGRDPALVIARLGDGWSVDQTPVQRTTGWPNPLSWFSRPAGKF